MLWLYLFSSGSKDGTVVRRFTSHQCGLVLIPAWCPLWVKFVVCSCKFPFPCNCCLKLNFNLRSWWLSINITGIQLQPFQSLNPGTCHNCFFVMFKLIHHLPKPGQQVPCLAQQYKLLVFWGALLHHVFFHPLSDDVLLVPNMQEFSQFLWSQGKIKIICDY